MKITASLSHLPKIEAYLAAKKDDLDLVPTRDQLRTLNAKLVDLRAKHSETDAECRRATDESRKLLKARLSEFEDAKKELASLVWPEEVRAWVLCSSVAETKPSGTRHHAGRAAAYAEYERTEAAYKAVPYGPDKTTLDALAAEIKTVEQQVTTLNQGVARVESALKKAVKNLPDHLLSLNHTALTELAALSIDHLAVPPEHEHPFPIQAGIIRREIEHECDCDKGYVSLPVTVGSTPITLYLNDEVRHNLCHEKARFDVDWLDGAVPLKHAHHRLHTLKPWDNSPYSVKRQSTAITGIPPLPDGLNGWLMLGPPGTSKTTYAAAAITDWLTFRILHHVEAIENGWDGKSPSERVNYWRVKAPHWIRATEAFEHKDFGDRSVAEPAVTTNKIEQATAETGWPPILWLEELDKVQATKPRLRNLYLLVDSVYEAGGIIVSTSNATGEALEKLLGEAIYRRLSGRNDDPAGYLVIDGYYKAPKNGGAA